MTTWIDRPRTPLGKGVAGHLTTAQEVSYALDWAESSCRHMEETGDGSGYLHLLVLHDEILRLRKLAGVDQ